MRQFRAVFTAAAFGIVTAGISGTAHAAAATPTEWKISSFHAALSAQSGGALQVHEEIVFDFGTTPGHGIIQYVNHTGLNTGGPDITVTGVKVTSPDGTPADTAVAESGGKTKITVGQATKTITGRHTYDVDFRVTDAVYADAAHPGTAALLWPVIDNWDVPISDIAVTLTMPGKLTADHCWAGPLGTDTSCDSQTTNDKTLTVKQAHLNADQQLTIRTSSAIGAATATLPTASAAQYPITAPSSTASAPDAVNDPKAFATDPGDVYAAPTNTSSGQSHFGVFVLVALLAVFASVVAFVRRISGGGGGGDSSRRRYSNDTWNSTSYTDTSSSWTDTSSFSGGSDSGGFSGGDSGQSGGW